MADQLFSPEFSSGALLLAVGIVGATVMPHVIYLHSALTQYRIRGENEGELKQIQRFERIDVIIAMTIAGLVNLAMLAIFAARFFGTDADSIEDAYHGLYADPGRWAAYLLGIALLASGLSSSSVGTLAGQVVMQGFIRRQIPIFRAARDHRGAGAHRRARSASTRPGRSSSARSCSRSASRSRSCRSSSSRATGR